LKIKDETGQYIMNNYLAIVEYDGTNFNGFQVQPEGTRTVQEELTRTVSTVLGHQIVLQYAGRTDAGVHARGQAINFKTGLELDLYRFKWSANRVLPEDIGIKTIKKMPLSFDSRRNAKSREYRYYVVNSNYQSVFLKNYSILLTRGLDIRRMKKAARMFVGKKDFASFASPSLSGVSTIRRIYSFTVTGDNDGVITFKVVASSFLYNMVRIMIGIILEVGRGEKSLEDLKQAIAVGGSNYASSMAPARGLFLTRVEY
jgi:tRNA pseudouridine38-40 synthase